MTKDQGIRMALVIENSPVVTDLRVEKILESWGVDPRIVHKTSSFAHSAIPSLFESNVATLLRVEKNEDLKSLTQAIEGNNDDYRFVYDGFIISTQGNQRNSAKKLEKLISGMGGVISISQSRDHESTAVSLIDEMKLEKTVTHFLKDYAGSSVEKIIPVYRNIMKLPESSRKNITVDDMWIRLSPQYGEISPWSMENHVFSGNVSQAITCTRRVAENASPLLVISIMKNSVSRLFRIKSVVDQGDAAIQDVAGKMSSRQLGFLTRRASKMSLSQLVSMAEEIAVCELNMKGNIALPSEDQLEVLITKLCRIASSSRSR